MIYVPNKTTHQYSSVQVDVFDKFVAIYGKKYGSFNPKILWRIFLSEFVSGYFKTKKPVLFATKPEGGGLRP